MMRAPTLVIPTLVLSVLSSCNLIVIAFPNEELPVPSLNDVARKLVAPGMGILAADESEGTIAKRFAVIGLPVTFETRRDYREMLFRSSEAMSKYISGVILTEETLKQDAADGTTFVAMIEETDVIHGFLVVC